MKINRTTIKFISALMVGLMITTSCEDYLDQSPEAVIKEEDVFSSFNTYQGYVDDIYQAVVDVTLGKDAHTNWNFSDDVIEDRGDMLSSIFDQGNYYGWTHWKSSQFYADIRYDNNNDNAKGRKGHWGGGWYGIRKANTALQNLDMLTAGTQEEKDLIAGQAYFFRAYFHFEIMRAWGGIAYIDKVFTPDDNMQLPRLSYRETALKAAEDFKKAAELLPASWDETEAGQRTLNKNEGRITKGAAYGYLGKNLLYAASPLMNGVSTGNYNYDPELAEEAAKAFNEVIKLANEGYHGLESWDDYYRNFYSLKREIPLGKEIIFNNPIYKKWGKRWDYGEFNLRSHGGWGSYASPTQNYVENFGMANGLPIEEEDSGYDPNTRWENRDPRFYYNIVKDGDMLVKNYSDEETKGNKYAHFYVGGLHRGNTNSITGYGHKKYRHITCNKWDRGYSWQYHYECPQMRLADVYLMYAEAVNEAFGPAGSVEGGMTAIEAVNLIRARAGVPEVDSRFLNKEGFREVIRRERAVELAFENHRWFDLRRWYVSHLPEYREKYVLEFDKDHTYFEKKLYNIIVFEQKHYWLPLPTDQVTLYPEFKQNPGW